MSGTAAATKASVWITSSLLAIAGSSAALEMRGSVELEAGPVWQTRNDLEIPNDGTATRFSLVDLVGKGPTASSRLTVTWAPSARHEVRALFAPLRIEESGVPASAVAFAGETFPAGESVDATYQFDSWRVSYRYRIGNGSRSRGWIGFTAKVRDAKVELRGPDRNGVDTDMGFVPLLHLGGDLRLSSRTWLRLDTEGLAGGPGRAIDASARLGYDLSDRWAMAAGYRTLEGGADVDSVYSFAWLHYAIVSLVWRHAP
jgi:hypothetical protein